MYPYLFCSSLLLTGHLYHISRAQNPQIPISSTTISANVSTSAGPTGSTAVSITSTLFAKKNVTDSKSGNEARSTTLRPDKRHRTSETPGTVTPTLTTNTVKNHSWTLNPAGNKTAIHTSTGATPTKGWVPSPAVTPSHPTTSVLTTLARESAVVLSSATSTAGSVPTQAPENSLAMISFGVMSFILVLIVVMVILVTAVNMRGRCQKNKSEGKKICDSVVSEGNVPITGRKESITLISVKTIHAEADMDCPLISAAHSTSLDEDQEVLKDLFSSKV